MQLQLEKQTAKSNLLRKCGLLAHTSAAFLKNCCTEKLFVACGSYPATNPQKIFWVMFHMKQLYYPNIDQTPCTIAHSPNPHNVGNSIATPVHFQLCVSFRMVRQVVEHGK